MSESVSVFAALVARVPDRDSYREHFRLALEAGEQSENAKQLLALLKLPGSPAATKALTDALAKMFPPK